METVDHNYLEGKKQIHFIGIGGSGMFPLAQILHKEGYNLTGSDNNESDILRMVRELGIPVTLGHRAENIKGADLILSLMHIFLGPRKWSKLRIFITISASFQ